MEAPEPRESRDFSDVINPSAHKPTVCVVVGPKAQQFLLNFDIIVSHSAYFEKALSGPWKESQELLVKFPDINADVFALFTYWLAPGVIGINMCATHDPISLQGELIVECWLLGDRFIAPTFQNAIVDFFFGTFNLFDFAHEEMWRLAYSSTTCESKLRRMIVDSWVWEGEAAAWTGQGQLVEDTVSFEFASDLVVGLLKKNGNTNWEVAPWVNKECKTYHVHKDGEAIPC